MSLSTDISPVIASTAQWLLRSYPATGGALDVALAEAQAHQATTAAAWLRYPTAADAAAVAFVGPGGSARLDWITGVDVSGPEAFEEPWRTWVDEVVASWAACLLTTPELADEAVAALSCGEHAAGMSVDFRRLTRPDDRDRRAATLLRHPDLLGPVADLHRPALVRHLQGDELDAERV
ncbi:hypothetical protein SAMN05428945_5283 [Streptomyces sp. 2224.1]|nr:hypothetical protein BX261_0050 [Streptomyces sp. 2321.6]SDR59645.1 hypothetical protein SAMN05216511_7177 [Streptomyces sp. KS_16]SEB67184.1 hypothetical protein SAMN05428940_0050 [Streptomyces sp. 2133.1]SED56158.1 hypothetical protein SAMN05428945_5283 [Streptomyces sp. 2224.1]SEF18152.1 hypothetical protein SAMN05428954_7224 [Streptomyces sp. 2112.3]SNC59435.1 hypothetical protein SAMN06272741_0053 [Streptomyces sp. 2114.4]